MLKYQLIDHMLDIDWMSLPVKPYLLDLFKLCIEVDRVRCKEIYKEWYGEDEKDEEFNEKVSDY